MDRARRQRTRRSGSGAVVSTGRKVRSPKEARRSASMTTPKAGGGHPLVRRTTKQRERPTARANRPQSPDLRHRPGVDGEPAATYEPLSAIDQLFLACEGPNSHMHVAATLVFDVGELATPEGGLDIQRIWHHVEGRLDAIPRFRQRLDYVPFVGQPLWIDDERFNLGFHVRHTSLPRPGGPALLKRLCGRIMSQRLDRGKPLWELWIVEGVEDGKFAVILKAHHCAVDGVGGTQLLSLLFGDESSPGATPWTPRPAPSRVRLLVDALARRAATPLALASFVRRRLRDPKSIMRDGDAFAGLWQAFGAGLRPAPDTPINRVIGPHRRFDWWKTDLADVKAVKNRLGGTVNDVVLATVAGGLQRFFRFREPALLSEMKDLRALVPVSTRTPEQNGTAGNHISGWLVPLPTAEHHPGRRFERVCAATAKLRNTKSTLSDAVVGPSGGALLALGGRFIEQLRPFNIVVTNIPGPPESLSLLGARLLEVYPQAPLFSNQGLGVALFSYGDTLYWGFNADCNVVPDLPDLVAAVAESFAELFAFSKEPANS